MKFKGILFDINGTLIDIQTDEGAEEIYRGVSHFLTYQGIHIHRWELRDEYFQIMHELRSKNTEAHPEFDAVELWREFLKRRPEALKALPKDKQRVLPLVLAEMYRGISRYRLQPYPEVRPVLEELAARYQMAVVSDAQSAWATAELRAVGIADFFKPVVISGDHGFRKPDPRLYLMALDGLGLSPADVLFVGNDMYRDVFGPKQLGMKVAYFSSNQGRKESKGEEPDYIIYNFGELRRAIEFLETQ